MKLVIAHQKKVKKHPIIPKGWQFLLRKWQYSTQAYSKLRAVRSRQQV